MPFLFSRAPEEAERRRGRKGAQFLALSDWWSARRRAGESERAAIFHGDSVGSFCSLRSARGGERHSRGCRRSTWTRRPDSCVPFVARGAPLLPAGSSSPPDSASSRVGAHVNGSKSSLVKFPVLKASSICFSWLDLIVPVLNSRYACVVVFTFFFRACEWVFVRCHPASNKIEREEESANTEVPDIELLRPLDVVFLLIIFFVASSTSRRNSRGELSSLPSFLLLFGW